SGVQGGRQRKRMVQPPVTGADSPADAGAAAKRNRAGVICRFRSLLVHLAACGAGDTAPWTGWRVADREAAPSLRNPCSSLRIRGLAAPRRTVHAGFARSPAPARRRE